MTDQDEKQLRKEIDHIFESGANEIRVFEMVKNFINKRYSQATANKYPWLKQDDLEFAIALQEENRLDAVKYLAEKARPHELSALRVAKDILDFYSR